MAASSLPVEVFEHIAFHAALADPYSAPETLRSLLLCNRSLYALLRPQGNARFYSRLFRHRFDTDALERRYGEGAQRRHSVRNHGKGKQTEGRHEGSLVFTSTASSTASEAFAAASFPSAMIQPHSSSASSLPPTPPEHGLTARHLADAFVDRIEVLKRIRSVGRAGTLAVYGHAVEDEDEDEAENELGELRRLTMDMWTAYLMILENDGKNVDQLVRFADIRAFLQVFYRELMLTAAVRPGYPPESPERTLYMHISHALLDFAELDAEHPSEADARFFVLKPYVFAAHNFDAFFAPWTLRRLPLGPDQATAAAAAPHAAAHEPAAVGQGGDDEPEPADAAFVANLRPRVRAQALPYLGRTIRIAPPIIAHAACRTFFLRVEREPPDTDAPTSTTAAAPAGDETTAANPPPRSANPAPSHQEENNAVTPPIPAAPTATTATATAAGLSYTELSCDAVALGSRDHDKDYTRLTACLDPFRSPGLAPLFHLGDFPGAWEGRFSFFDFDSYRDMLAGRMISLYQGPFGDQPQVWKLEERVRRLRDGKLVRGGGKAMGIRVREDSEGVREALQRAARAEAEAAGADDGVNWDEVGRASSSSAAIARTRTASSKHDDEEVEEELDPDEDYEIELQGTGHSAWGQFILQGRVRAWDGMFTLTKEYTPGGRGRWLYRGYLVAGGLLVGRWRDTFTPEHLSGYEGTFLMRKRS